MTQRIHTAAAHPDPDPLFLEGLPRVIDDQIGPRRKGAIYQNSDHLVREADPRASAAGKCGSCRGEGGRMVDTSDGGVTRQTWQSCTACHGSGQAG
ncbi:hypothetical protein ACQEVX_35555 [Streptomyces syringium]